MLTNADSIHIPLADGVVQCVVTSPPYWGLRAYSGEQERVWGGAADCEHEWGGEIPDTHPSGLSKGGALGADKTGGGRDTAQGKTMGAFCQHCGAWRGGLGLEPTPEMFIEHLVQVFREVRRVMRDDGVAWVNMGDSFNDKQLLMMPHRLALALQADGWWVRSDVVWAKPNPMPESLSGWRWEQCRAKVKAGQWQDCTGCDKCKDNDGLVLRRGSWRPTSSHEYVFMLAKSSTYFSDGEAVREGRSLNGDNPAGRNLRSVWNIATQPYKGAHYATFPLKLAQRCVLASTSRHACAECGTAWSRVVERTKHLGRDMEAQRSYYKERTGRNDGYTPPPPRGTMDATKTLDHRPSCQCGADVKPCLVLDPFAGSGTVGQVCRELPHRRDFIGLDLSFDYLRDQALVRSERKTPASKLAELPMFA